MYAILLQRSLSALTVHSVWYFVMPSFSCRTTPALPLTYGRHRGAMACFKDAEQYLAKLPSISLEGMEPLDFQSAKEQGVAMETQGYKVGLAGCLPHPEGLPSCHWESVGLASQAI